MAVVSPRASIRGYAAAPVDWHEWPEWCRKLAEVINRVRVGKLANAGTVTLTASQTSTTITNHLINPDSTIVLIPTSEDAAGEVGYWVSTYGDGTAIITHANDSRTTRSFKYLVFG